MAENENLLKALREINEFIGRAQTEIEETADMVRNFMAGCAAESIKKAAEEPVKKEAEDEMDGCFNKDYDDDFCSGGKLPRYVESHRVEDPDGFKSLLTVKLNDKNLIEVSLNMSPSEDDAPDLFLTKDEAQALRDMLDKAILKATFERMDIPDVSAEDYE